VRRERALDVGEIADGKMDGQRGARAAEFFQRLAIGGMAEDCMAVRVRITVCAISGRVNSVLSAAAAAAKAGTPGVTS
jgi:hypothetical protein